MTISIVLIPSNPLESLQCHFVDWDTHPHDIDIDSNVSNNHLYDIKKLLLQEKPQQENVKNNNSNTTDDVVEVPLMRPCQDSPGFYAYYLYTNSNVTYNNNNNIRATRLAMACGLLSLRFHRNVVVVRSHPTRQPRWVNLSIDELWRPCEVSPDLRPSIQQELMYYNKSMSGPAPKIENETLNIPLWLNNAAQQNYHDAAAVARMAHVMKHKNDVEVDDDQSSSDSSTTSNGNDGDVEYGKEIINTTTTKQQTIH